MSVQTVRPSALPLPKSLSSSAPSVASSGAGSGIPNAKGRAVTERTRAGSTTPPSNGPMTRSTIPVLYNNRSIAMIPRVAAAGLPHKNSHKTIGIPNGNSTSINISIKKSLNSPTSQPNHSYWRFGQSKGGSNMTAGSREIIRRHSARASVSGDSGNVTPQQSSPVTALRKVSTSSSTTDYGSRKISTCSSDSNFSSYGRKISSDSSTSVSPIIKPHRKPIIGANSFGAADTKAKKRRSITSDNRENNSDLHAGNNKSLSTTANNELRLSSSEDCQKKKELQSNTDSTLKDGPGKVSSDEMDSLRNSCSPSRTVDLKQNNRGPPEVTPVVGSGPSTTSTTITVKTKGKKELDSDTTCWYLSYLINE